MKKHILFICLVIFLGVILESSNKVFAACSTLAECSADWEKATTDAERNIAHEQADRLRGYRTNDSGTEKVSELDEGGGYNYKTEEYDYYSSEPEPKPAPSSVTADQCTTIDSCKKAFANAEESGDTTAMTVAHQRADALRGYVTDSWGSVRMDNLSLINGTYNFTTGAYDATFNAEDEAFLAQSPIARQILSGYFGELGDPSGIMPTKVATVDEAGAIIIRLAGNSILANQTVGDDYRKNVESYFLEKGLDLTGKSLTSDLLARMAAIAGLDVSFEIPSNLKSINGEIMRGGLLSFVNSAMEGRELPEPESKGICPIAPTGRPSVKTSDARAWAVVDYPNGGEGFTAGGNVVINWRSSGTNIHSTEKSIRIALIKGEETVNSLVTENDGSENLVLRPNHPSGSDYKIAVTYTYNYVGCCDEACHTSCDLEASVTDKSDANFCISAPAPSCSYFKAEPAVIDYNSTAVLSWSCPVVASVTLDGVEQLLTGRAEVKPLVTSTYILQAKNSDGVIKDLRVMVTVAEPPPAPTCSFSASPTEILLSKSSKLSWVCTDATLCSIDNGIGNVALSGTKTVTPDKTTTYVLSCDNKGVPIVGGSPTATVKVFTAATGNP